MNSASQEPNPTEPDTEYELLAPDGTLIRGTLERIEALKGIFRIQPTPGGGFTYEPDFERTELFWDTQATAKTKDGETLFIDDNRNTWPASQLVIKRVE